MYSLNQLQEIALKKIESTSNLKVFENIVDKGGHKRFVEQDIDLSATSPEGMTKIYGKLSLSGSHLLIVLCISIADTTVVADNIGLCNIELPKWIYDKIYPIASSIIELGTFNAYASNLSTQAFNVRLVKSATPNVITLMKTGAVTLTAERVARISFDLLIDNE